MLFLLSDNLNAQKDVTKFLGIPVDGFKTDMMNKLKSKGFTVNSLDKNILSGEFNGRNVHIVVKTNSNKVYRLAISDATYVNESDIKIRFNNLIKQFQNNKNYISLPDSIIAKYTIPDDERISYEMTVNNKQYEAIFYQKTQSYDALVREKEILLSKGKLTEEDLKKYEELSTKIVEEALNSLNKTVWFTIGEFNDKYYIIMFYDNVYNEAKGDDL
jgi:hypothetical protein